MFYRLSNKHLKFRQKYSATRRIFNSLLGVWISQSSLVFDITSSHDFLAVLLPVVIVCSTFVCLAHLPKNLGEQGWRSGERARLPPMCPGFDSRTRRHICGLSLLLVFCSALRGFSPGTPVFPSPQNQHFQIQIRSWKARAFLVLRGLTCNQAFFFA